VIEEDKMSEIILVQPRYGSWETMGVRLPHAMLSLASLPYRKGYKVVLIDQRVDKNWKTKLIEHSKKGPLCVALSTTTGMQISNCLELAKIIREHTGSPIIWGGPHPTLYPDQTIEHPLVDMVMVGEGEFSFMKIVERLGKNQTLEDIPGLLYKKDGKIIKNREREIIKDFESIPDLPYELVNMKNYYGLNFSNGGASTTIITSRGCPFNCGFCAIPVLYKRSWKALSPQLVIERIKRLVEKYNIKDFYFQEDNFAVDLNRVRKIAELIIKEGLDITWGTLGIRADSIARMDKELLKLMYKSGCRNLDVGVESGSPRVLGLIGGAKKIEDMLNANRKVSEYQISMKYTFIAGYPTEKLEDLKMSVVLANKLIKENQNAYTPFFVACPYPGTRLFDIAIENGMKVPQNLEGWAGFDQTVPKHENVPWMSKKQFEICKMIAFTSYFTSKKMSVKYKDRKMRLLLSLYNPIAKFRFNNLISNFFIEGKIAEKLMYA
jgi:radical SAM superfamily enzyme YgiQ (UPF0313 family)